MKIPLRLIPRLGWLLLPLLMAAAVSAPSADAAERVALVIGNSVYDKRLPLTKGPNLPNPGRDADLIAGALRAAGFRATVRKDLTKAGMETAVREFHSQLGRGATALIYYAGHGIQVGGVNYLLPVDTPPELAEFEAAERCYKAELMLKAMSSRDTELNLLVLDCCRDNPFTRGWRSFRDEGVEGLAEMRAPQETLIAYATAPGRVAQDGQQGNNSPYAAALAEEMLRPEVKIQDVFFRVGQRVNQSTGGQQRPWVSTDLVGHHVLLRGSGPVITRAPDSAPSKPAVPPVAGAGWLALAGGALAAHGWWAVPLVLAFFYVLFVLEVRRRDRELLTALSLQEQAKSASKNPGDGGSQPGARGR